MSQYPQRIGEADCRDYLRTGRCKYGESCKYHHPPNVQSGGGIKTPLDPNEPPFPLRPNEPNCQYFLKHGTCKFGQTCKFNHPPNLSGINNTTKHQGMSQFQSSPILGSMSSSIGNDVIVILPQRPNEPECIYFLRNGRCKYGSTCKFHHPLSYQTLNIGTLNDNGSVSGVHQQQHIVAGRQQLQQSRGRSVSAGSPNDISVNSASTHVSVPIMTGQGIIASQHVQTGTSGPTHILVPEGQIAVMLNPSVNKGSQSLQTSNGNQFLTGQVTSTNTNSQSTMIPSPIMTSSLASSYDTLSSFELPENPPRWQRSGSHQHLPNFASGNNFGSNANSRPRVPPRQPQHHYVVMSRASSSNDVKHNVNNELNQSSTPIRKSFLKLASTNNENVSVGDRRSVSLGSSAEITMFSSMDNSSNKSNNNRHFNTSTIQNNWESSSPTRAASNRLHNENNMRTTNLPRQDSGNLPNIMDGSYQTPIHREMLPRNPSCDGSSSFYSNEKLSWKNPEIQNRSELLSRPSITNNLPRQNYPHKRFQETLNNHSEPSLGLIESKPTLEEDGLSTMTSALLDMLDTSEEPQGSFNSTNFSKSFNDVTGKNLIGRKSSLPDMRNIYFNMQEDRIGDNPSSISMSTQVCHPCGLSDDASSYFDRSLKQEESSVPPSSMNDRSTCHAVANNRTQIQSHGVIQPQSSPSNIGLYLP